MKASKVILLSPSMDRHGRALANQCSIPLIDATHLATAKARLVETFIRSQIELTSAEPTFVFLFSDIGLSLGQITEGKILSIRADFYSPTVNYRRQKGGGKGQMIAKAVGLNSGHIPSVLDATAGLGGDAFVLASLGCSLAMTERVPEVRALVRDGLRAAERWGRDKDAPLIDILSRMHLFEIDANSYLQQLKPGDEPDVVYLDPMFPVRNKSAQVKKEMHVFHQLVGTDPDAGDLLELARSCAKKRVVVKRPRIAPSLTATKPSYILKGKSNRFDIYVCG